MKLPVRFFMMIAMLSVVGSFPVAAQAHKVNIFAYAEGGRVYTESYYADGGRCVGSEVTVEDSTGAQLLEGATDGDGRFSFDIPAVEGDLRVVVHAGMGHQNDYVIKASELEAVMPAGEKAEQPANKPGKAVKTGPPATKSAAPVTEPPSSEAVEPPVSTITTTPEELRAVVDEVVEARLRPVLGRLAGLEGRAGRPAMQDTISGIGYIMGILAVILYLRSRRK